MAEKMRAVVMTGFVPAIGFVPMALAHVTGAEVQKTLATVVIGGLIAATILTLIVLPAIAKVVLGASEQRSSKRDDSTEPKAKIGRAHVRTPVTNEQLVSSFQIDK